MEMQKMQNEKPKPFMPAYSININNFDDFIRCIWFHGKDITQPLKLGQIFDYLELNTEEMRLIFEYTKLLGIKEFNKEKYIRAKENKQLRSNKK